MTKYFWDLVMACINFKLISLESMPGIVKKEISGVNFKNFKV